MKRKFLVPALAIIFAAGGAFASSSFAPTYYLNDTSCSSTVIPEPCEPGDLFECREDGQQVYTKLTPSSPCQQFFTDIPPAK